MLLRTAMFRQIDRQQDKYGLFTEFKDYGHSALLCLF